MAPSPNTTLGHYKIISKLGAGGMGEVYRAHDSRLNREVAIKVLPSDVATHEDRLRRFEQEARATSALNHPNILTVYDIGEHAGSPFIVAELLEGQELRDRLNEAPISLRKVTEYAQQIVSGLSAAHERGVVHRDLKPENIFITKDDRVKILDFGLAKLREYESGPTSSEDATRKVLTNPGVMMGTAGYMSPEQVRAQPTDHRSDIFSFGSILYEMITGHRAFHHETMAETMSAILREDPRDLGESNPSVNPALERIVRRCLEKKPERRFQSTADLAFALESLTAPTISSSTTVTVVPAAPNQVRPNRRTLFYALGLLLLALGGVAGIVIASYLRKPSTPFYQQLTFRRGIVNHARFAPDGKTVVYSASWNGKPFEIFSTVPGSSDSRPLLTDADILSVSTAGELAILTKRKHLGQFIYTGTLARMPLNGGAPRDVVENAMEADWSADGSNLVVTRYVDGQTKIEYPIGKVLYETAGYISYPRMSPDGKSIAFVDHELQWDNRGRVAVIDLAGKKTFLSEESVGQEGLAWAPAGDEVWFTAAKTSEAQVLYGVTLNGKLREILRVPGDVWLHDAAPDGRVLLARLTQTTEIEGLAPGDTKERDLTFLDFGRIDDLSADGRTFVYEYWGATADRNYTIYLSKTDGSPAIKLGDGGSSTLSPDGKWVLAVNREPPHLTLLPTGAGVTKNLETYSIAQYNSVEWLPDGKRFLFVGREAGHLDRCFMQSIDSGGPKAVTPEGVVCAGVSPDGKSVLGLDPQGSSIYPVDGTGAPSKVIGLEPADQIAGWSADGKSIFVYPVGASATKISRLDLATGRRDFLRDITLTDPAGVLETPTIILTPDAKSYVYTTRRFLTELYVAQGLK